MAMVEHEILGQGEFSLEKACGCGDRIWGNRCEHQTPFFLSQMDFASGFEPEFPSEMLGNQNLPFGERWATGHNFLLLLCNCPNSTRFGGETPRTILGITEDME